MGVTQWTGTISPENYIVQAFQSGSLVSMFFFREQEMANLVAKDFSQVVELCGGKKATFDTGQPEHHLPPAPPSQERLPDLVATLPVPMTGQLTIKNVGTATAAATKLTMDCQKEDSAPDAQRTCPDLPSEAAATYYDPAFPMNLTIKVPALAPGESFSHTLSFWSKFQWPSGKYKFTVIADAAHVLHESDVKNNIATSTLIVP